MSKYQRLSRSLAECPECHGPMTHGSQRCSDCRQRRRIEAVVDATPTDAELELVDDIARAARERESRLAVCFLCGERRPLVADHRVCDDCHAANGRCGRCGFVRPDIRQTPPLELRTRRRTAPAPL